MFTKIFTLFALLVAALAAPAPAPAPNPQYVTYAATDYVYPSGAVVPSVVSPYAAPVSYSALPLNTVFVR